MATPASASSAWYEPVLDRGWVPDSVIRAGIRHLLAQRLREAATLDKARFIETLRSSPIAIHTSDANAQHYEVPAEFYELVLGRHRKYSCGLWDKPGISLDEAEQRMLDLTLSRARVENGHSVLDLGCGWGSLSLYAAQRFPASQIVAVSNSHSQRKYIEARARAHNLSNLRAITADMNDFAPAATFDRVVSVEMFEHMRNYAKLLSRIASWLNPGGLLFVHSFAHTRYAYPFETGESGDWMAQHFFTGGIMPSLDLLSHFAEDMRIRDQWTVDGTHYQQTCEAWLENVDRNQLDALGILAEVYGFADALRWLARWRVFFMACSELFGYRGGKEWVVAHYLLERARPA